MTVAVDVSIRNAWMDAITTRAGNGAKLQLYTTPRPASGAAITSQTKLSEHTCGTPFAPAGASGVLSPTLPADVNGLATGTVLWGRITTSAGAWVADADVGTDIVLSPSTTVTTGVAVHVSSFSFTAPNA